MTFSLRALGMAAALLLGEAGGWLSARPDYAWRFPRDHYAHPGYRTEWWYFTGQLAQDGDTAPRLGYQLTIFRIGIVPQRPPLRSDWAAANLVMGHAAITDFRTGRHRFSEVLLRAIPLYGGFGAPGDSLLAWCRAPEGTGGDWSLRWTGAGFAFAARDARQGFGFQLAGRPERPPTLEGPNGYSRKGRDPGNASEYYSYTRLATSGTVSLGGTTFTAHGLSWMDQEVGSSQLDARAVGWDWFSLQLADGRDVMLYLLRDSSEAPTWGGGTIVEGPGRSRHLELRDFSVRRTATWTSPAGARYPARWTVTIPGEGLMLDVRPIVADQENRSAIARKLFYWEGAVVARDAEGHPVGRGYVELTGYGASLKPAI